MKKNSASQSAFFNPRVLIGFIFCLAGVFLSLLGFGAFSNVFAQTKGTKTGPQTNPSNGRQAPFGRPDVVQMIGPVAQNQDLRSLPYIPPNKEVEERRLTRYPHPETGSPERQGSRIGTTLSRTCIKLSGLRGNSARATVGDAVGVPWKANRFPYRNFALRLNDA